VIAPNPFHDRTVITFARVPARVADLAIYDVRGRCVRTIRAKDGAGMQADDVAFAWTAATIAAVRSPPDSTACAIRSRAPPRAHRRCSCVGRPPPYLTHPVRRFQWRPLSHLIISAWRSDLMPAATGYYRHPSIHADTIVFISEDDLWSVPSAEGSRGG